MAPTSPLGVWDEGDGFRPDVMLDCLLPTGVLIQLQTRKDGILADIKEELWRASQNYPLYSLLKDKNTYMFMCINQRAEKEELMDEGKRLCDVRPFQPMLRVVEKKGNKAETILNFQISSIIGKGLKEFDALKNTEVSDFRVHMKQMCLNFAKERDAEDWRARANYLYPPDLANFPGLPKHIEQQLGDSVINVIIQIGGTDMKFGLPVPMGAMPQELMNLFMQMVSDKGHKLKQEHVLKVVGREEYLIGDYPLTQFNTIQRNLVKGTATRLVLVERHTLFVNERPQIPPRPNGRTVAPQHKPRRTKVTGTTLLWDLKHNYSIHADMAANLSILNSAKVYLRTGIYHGPEVICGSKRTEEVGLKEQCAKWNEELIFDIQLLNLPRMARLCFALFAIYDKKGTAQRKGRKGKMQDGEPLAWVNIPVFDYIDVLRTGCLQLYMWPINDEKVLSEELLNPRGSVECNPNVEEAIALTLRCNDYNIPGPIYYPGPERVATVAKENTDQKSEQYNNIARGINPQHLEVLRAMVEGDPLAELHDKDLIWMLREECRLHFPNCLARLVLCVEWNNHVQVALMQDLLKRWPKTMPPRTALELLDFNYADRAVRNFAVECLSKISDLDLCQYLLQLVQVLKYESYMDCQLVQFLLRRALRSQRVGHIFFWLLKSEMHVPSVSVRYGLILEAYCHGSISHVKLLSKQVAALEKLGHLCITIQKDDAYKNISNTISKKGAFEKMRKMLSQPSFSEVLSDIPSSLDPSYRLKGLKMEECKFMDSKKRPLWLVWENKDKGAPDVLVMFKKGDDLRQDMLTLQILRIIESLWRDSEECLDLRMNAYGCLATGDEEGLIEIVSDSDTIANIQKRNAGLAVTAAFKKDGIWKWLHENKDSQSMKKAIEEFTRSCAGYCVATYVLGIGDRHSDNLMLKRNGQMFHIDFGHFLGNFKSKLGVRRERTPFVLTNDFVYVIKEGPAESEKAMDRFQKMCEKAYMILRTHSHFLISLFMMMMNTGIPQLSSIKDIHYLRNTLRPQDSSEAALKDFQAKFNESLKSGWKTALNFTAHNLARDNT